MNNYNKILEAVNRGIKFALDDFEDDELQGQTNSKVNHQHGTKEWMDLMNEVVDLGLPSGTLWCKYNLDVNPNQLSKAEDWYGNYYAWGELEPNKPEFSWSTYKYAAEHYTDLSENERLTKYCNNPEYGLNGFTDNLTELLPEDDAAYQNKKFYNFKFHIPTKEQCEELIIHTQNYWVKNYNPNNIEHHANDDGIQGLNGRVFVGKNGNTLFIPAAGYRSGSPIHNERIYCCLWSSNIQFGRNSCYLSFNSSNIDLYSDGRYFGFSIRQVINL